MTRFAAFAVCLAFAVPLAGLGAADAAPCRDAKGKFVTCPVPAAKKAPCRDAKGKFVSCPAGSTAPK